jgi:hypothetical protein
MAAYFAIISQRRRKRGIPKVSSNRLGINHDSVVTDDDIFILNILPDEVGESLVIGIPIKYVS